MSDHRRLKVLMSACAGAAVALAFAVAPLEAGRDEWTPIGPLGGTIYSLAVHPTNSNVMYTPIGGKLYASEDGGASWNINPTCPNGVYKVLVDPLNPETMYALATGNLYRSTNAGNTWTRIGQYVASFAFDQSHPNRLFVGCMEGKVWKSTNSGDTWTDVSTGSWSTISALAVSANDSNTLYAGAMGDGDSPGEGVFKSTDGGLTWAITSSGLPDTDIGMLLADPLHPNTIFASTQGGPMYAGYGIYRSTDAGRSWTAANTGFPCTYCPYDITVQDIKAIPGRSGEFCAVVNGGAFNTDDGGVTWNPCATNVNDIILTVEIRPSDPDVKLFGGLNGGVWKVTPTSVERFGILPTGLSGIAIDPLNTSNLYGVTGIAYISHDGGRTWELSMNGTGWGSATAIAINPVQTNILFVGDYNSPAAVYRSVDGAVTWDTALAHISVNDIVIDPVTPNIVYAGGLDAPHVGGLFKSTDDGLSWTKIHSSIVMSIAVNPLNPNTIYIGTQLEGVKKSTDGGSTWVAANNGLPTDIVSSGFVTAVAIDPLKPEVLYCGTYGRGVFKSTNAGEEWTAASSGLPTTDIRKIVIDYMRPSILYAKSYSAGVFRSVDGARNWEAMNTGLPGLGLSDLVIDPVSPNVLYCCGRIGVFRYESSFDPFAGSEAAGGPPIDIKNFPNPFSQGTTIEYSVKSLCLVRLQVYDVAGRKVATLVDAQLEPGSYRATLRGANLSAGVYFIKGSFGEHTIARKCVLMK